MRSLHWKMQIKGVWGTPQQAFCNAKQADVYTSALLATTMRPFSPYSANFSSESYQEENHSNTNEPRDDFLLMELPESKRSYKQNTQ